MTPQAESPEVYLHPGEHWFGGEETRVRTLLGSCVAVTLWHPQRRIGGMCHYMLPGGHREGHRRDGRYAAEAISLLRDQVVLYRTQPHEYEAKLFGGGNMFNLPPSRSANNTTVSDRNIIVARELMARYGFRVKTEHMGGQGHRNIIFEVGNGDVWVRQTPLAPDMQPAPPALNLPLRKHQ